MSSLSSYRAKTRIISICKGVSNYFSWAFFTCLAAIVKPLDQIRYIELWLCTYDCTYIALARLDRTNERPRPRLPRLTGSRANKQLARRKNGAVIPQNDFNGCQKCSPPSMSGHVRRVCPACMRAKRNQTKKRRAAPHNSFIHLLER